MKKNFTFILVFILSAGFFNSLNAQTCFATVASGDWSNTGIWETYSTYAAALAGSPGTGTAATGIPSGTHNILVRTGHTVSMAASSRNCKGMIIQSGGKLWANQTGSITLKVGGGGTGFTYPLVDTVQVDGTLGGANDGVYRNKL